MVFAVIGLNFLILIPLNWNVMRSLVFYRERIFCEGGWIILAMIHPPSCFLYPSWEPPVNCDVHKIFLDNHFIQEVGVTLKEHDLAEMNGMFHFFHLSGQGGENLNTFLSEVPTVAYRNELFPLPFPTKPSRLSLPGVTSKSIMYLSMTSSWSVIRADIWDGSQSDLGQRAFTCNGRKS